MKHFVFKIAVILLCSICIAQQLYAQHEDVKTEEGSDTTVAQLRMYLQRMNEWKKSSSPDNYDSVYAINDSMMAYLSVIAATPAFFNTNYSSLKKEGMQISRSDDSVCISMNWEVAQQGNMHYYNGLLYYNTSTGITGGVFKNGINLSIVATLHTAGDKIIYLLLIKDSYASEHKEMLLAKSPDLLNGATTFNDFPFFFLGSQSSASLSYNYSVPSISAQIDIPDITITRDKKYIYVPVVQADGTFTHKYKVYKYDGDKFVYKKISKKK